MNSLMSKLALMAVIFTLPTITGTTFGKGMPDNVGIGSSTTPDAAIDPAGSPLNELGTTAHAATADECRSDDADEEIDRTIVRARPFAIDPKQVAKLAGEPGGTIDLPLFDDARFTGIVERSEIRSTDEQTLFGRLLDEPGSNFTLVIKKNVIVANIRIPGRQAYYQIRPTGPGTHAALEINESNFPPCGVEPEQMISARMNAAPRAPRLDGCDDDGSQIDVLVVYTPNARLSEGGTAGIETMIDLAVVESNYVYERSGIFTRLHLVHSAEVEYDESGTYSDHLNYLTDPEDGVIDNVHRLRDLYHADMVVMIVDDCYYCGLGWLMRDLSPDFEEFAFSVTCHLCATGIYTFAHELGHNMGCHHNRANAPVSGVYDYSYGYQAPDQSFRTVMAYDCPDGCPRVANFSNPDVTYLDQPTGVPVGDPEAAHNALTINNTALTVANFRRYFDCNNNDVCDDVDISTGASEDCNDNGLPDDCEPDCNNNTVPDDCDLDTGTSEDCNYNGMPDECEPLGDCQPNGLQDICDIFVGTSQDCNENLVPDECEPDCNDNGLPDGYDLDMGTSEDCNDNKIPDECDLEAGAGEDCNYNQILDECDVYSGIEQDCNSNLSPDLCDIQFGISSDSDLNGIPDDCESIGVWYQKNRYISILPSPPGKITAIRVTLTDLPAPFEGYENTRMWVGPVTTRCENAGEAVPPPGGCGPAWTPNGPPLDFKTANLQNTQHCMDFGSGGPLHVTGFEIVPGARYDVQRIECADDPGNEANYSTPLSIHTGMWGDTCNNFDGTHWTMPNGTADVTLDVTACLDKFKNVPGAPLKVRCDLEPELVDQLINISDIVHILDAFKGGAYPFLPEPD